MQERFKHQYQHNTYTLNKILVEVGQVVGQSWSGLFNICQDMFLVKATRS